MDRLSLHAQQRIVLGKKVKQLRKDGKLPAHVFGKKINTEHVTVEKKDFIKTLNQAGETGLIDLIDEEKVRPVLIRGVQYDPVSGNPLHIDFYQVNLAEKVTVQVPLGLIGEDPESVKLGETIVLQTLNEVEVEALPTDLIEKIEIDISPLKRVNDAITVGQLNYDHSKITVLADLEEVVVKLAPAISADMEALLAEQEAEAAAAVAEEAVEEGAEEKVEGEGEEIKEVAEGETEEAADVPSEGGKEEQTEG